MPELNQGALTLLVTLLPGFLALRVRAFFMPARERDLFERVAEVVAFSLSAYLLVSVSLRLDGRPGWMLLPGENPDLVRGAVEFQLGRYLRALVVVSALLGAAVGVIEAHDFHYKLARLFGLTDRSGTHDAWQEAFSKNRTEWVLVHLADGRRLRGWPVLCSEHGSRPSLFLSSAAWIREDGVSVPIPGPGVLVTEQAEVRYAEFLSR